MSAQKEKPLGSEFKRSGPAIPKGKTRTGSWDRAVIFDPKDNRVDIRKKCDVKKDMNDGHFRCKELKLPKGRRNVSIFMEQDDETRLKVDEERQSNDVFLARLNLKHLGLTNRALFSLGYLSTLYVISVDLSVPSYTIA